MSLIMEPLISLANISTVLLGAFNKVPQILSVVRARSADGLSIPSVLLELTGYCITMSYFIANQYTLASYLEYPLLVAQDVCLMMVVLWLGAAGGVLVAGYAGLLLSLISAMVGGMLSDTVMTLLVSTSTPISAVSKLVQLSSIIKRRSSEGVAVNSWLISSYTSLTRLLTVYVATADIALLANFGVSLFLNASIVLATLYYAPLSSASANASASAKEKIKKDM